MDWKVVKFNSVIDRIICGSNSVIVLNRDTNPMKFLKSYKDNKGNDIYVFSDGRHSHNYNTLGECIDMTTFTDYEDPVPQEYEGRNSYQDLKVLALDIPENKQGYILVTDTVNNQVFQVHIFGSLSNNSIISKICNEFNLNHTAYSFIYSETKYNVEFRDLNNKKLILVEGSCNNCILKNTCEFTTEQD